VGNVANLIFEGAEELREAALLGLKVLRIDFPLSERLLCRELYDCHPFAIFSNKALMGNVTGNTLRQLTHFFGHRVIFLLHTGHETGSENGNDHSSYLCGQIILMLPSVR